MKVFRIDIEGKSGLEIYVVSAEGPASAVEAGLKRYQLEHGNGAARRCKVYTLAGELLLVQARGGTGLSLRMKKMMCRVLGHDFEWSPAHQTMYCRRCGNELGRPAEETARPSFMGKLREAIRAWIASRRQ